jgi:hypothetical protein
MEQVFAQFTHLKKGVAPYQMPSFTLQMVLHTYLAHSKCQEYPHGSRLSNLINQLLEINSTDFDIYFTEEDALYVSAGTYIAGMKQETPHTSLIPLPIKLAWESDPTLQKQFPQLNDLTTTNNILRWAQEEGRISIAQIAQYLDALTPFNKHGDNMPSDRTVVRLLPFVEPYYGAIGYEHNQPMEVNVQLAELKFQPQPEPETEENVETTRPSLLQRSLMTLRQEGMKAFIIEVHISWLRARPA